MKRWKKVSLIILSVILVLFLAVGAFAAKVYFDLEKTANKTYEKIDRIKTPETRKEEVNVTQGKPFSILLLGIDTGDEGRVDQGRSDSIMVATVNPQNKKVTILSIARDTYTDIIGRGTKDKINHAYAFGGAPMSIASVENLLSLPIDFYVAIDMTGLKEVVDAVGGVNVENKLAFSYNGSDFPIGKLHLNGQEALNYARMRYDDPAGDYGRQDRQRAVVSAIIKSAMNLSTLTKYQSVLTAISGNVKTDLTWNDMKRIQQEYKSALGTVDSEQLKGDGDMIDGVSYQIIAPEELERVRTLMQEQLK
ncbi:MAG: LCP family protein [Lactobacillales bacterium]|nr:LCP family protein [Lactobacillales bacterium]